MSQVAYSTGHYGAGASGYSNCSSIKRHPYMYIEVENTNKRAPASALFPLLPSPPPFVVLTFSPWLYQALEGGKPWNIFTNSK